MQQLKYDTELRAFDALADPDVEIDATELALAEQIVDQIATDVFTPESYTDSVAEQLQSAIEQKIAGHEFTLAPAEEPKAQVIDLMAALKASLESDGSEKPEAPAASARGRAS